MRLSFNFRDDIAENAYNGAQSALSTIGSLASYLRSTVDGVAGKAMANYALSTLNDTMRQTHLIATWSREISEEDFKSITAQVQGAALLALVSRFSLDTSISVSMPIALLSTAKIALRGPQLGDQSKPSRLVVPAIVLIGSSALLHSVRLSGHLEGMKNGMGYGIEILVWNAVAGIIGGVLGKGLKALSAS